MIREPITFERNESSFPWKWIILTVTIIAFIALIIITKPWQYLPQSAPEELPVEETVLADSEQPTEAEQPFTTQLANVDVPPFDNKCAAILGLVTGSKSFNTETKELQFAIKNNGKVDADGTFIIFETADGTQTFNAYENQLSVGETQEFTLTVPSEIVKIVPAHDGSACMNQVLVVLK